ncbi:hypothetical protein DER44DRAFT_127469 [Fusarium oxysporum]|nr:hypothetical protein DER44DRAFT_127469 [Fusarium oxysporum]
MFTRYLLVSLTYLLQSASSEATQTIASADDYQLQRSCAISCWWLGDPDGNDSSDVLGRRLQCCDGVPCRDVKDSCYCRPDLRVSASSHLSECVVRRCENEVDFSTAMNIYDDYCREKRNAASEPAETEATATVDLENEAEETAIDRGPGNQATADGSSSGAVIPVSGAFLVVRSRSIDSTVPLH